MFVHLGGDITVTDTDIAAVIDLDTCPSSSKDMSNFLKAEEESMRIENIDGDIPKTIVITSNKTYVSPLSSLVLLKRLTKQDPADLWR